MHVEVCACAHDNARLIKHAWQSMYKQTRPCECMHVPHTNKHAPAHACMHACMHACCTPTHAPHRFARWQTLMCVCQDQRRLHDLQLSQLRLLASASERAESIGELIQDMEEDQDNAEAFITQTSQSPECTHSMHPLMHQHICSFIHQLAHQFSLHLQSIRASFCCGSDLLLRRSFAPICSCEGSVKFVPISVHLSTRPSVHQSTDTYIHTYPRTYIHKYMKTCARAHVRA